jgi:hypothetical protein
MDSIADGSVIVQSSCQSVPSPPPWFGEVALIVQHLRKHEILSTIAERVLFARRRFGHYEVIDFVAVRIALCDQWGAHARSVLPAPAPLCLGLHGALRTRAFARSLHAQPLFSCSAS